MIRREDLRVYAVTDPGMLGNRRLEDVVGEMFRAGVRIVQLRDKEASTRSLVEQARRLVAVAEAHRGLLVVNDRVDVALAAGAHGVHVGSDDMPVAEARRLLGPRAVLGVSVRTVDEAWEAARAGADYVAASHVFPTDTKQVDGPALGLDGVRRLSEASPLPVVGIGGIGPHNAAEVVAAGAEGVAVVSAIMAAPDIAEACRALFRAVEEGRGRREGAPGMEALGEFGIVELFRRAAGSPPGGLGIGDDCALVPTDQRGVLVTVDMLVESVHFLRHGISPRQLGWKAVAAGLSDVAAMGGRPLAVFLALGLPRETERSFLESFRQGVLECCGAYRATLAGGDTTSSPLGVVVDVAVVGRPHPRRTLRRSDARPGHLVCLARALGGSGAGLHVVLEGRASLEGRVEGEILDSVLQRHLEPRPEVELGRLLADLEGTGGVIDISDGLVADLRHLDEESQVEIELRKDSVPVLPEARALAEAIGQDATEWALFGGEEYTLAFTLAPEAREAAVRALEEMGRDLMVIGHVREGRGRVVLDGRPVEGPGGWDHFRRR